MPIKLNLLFQLLFILALTVMEPADAPGQDRTQLSADYLASEDLVILDDNFRIKVMGQKVYYMEVFIYREVQYRVNTAEGAAILDTIELPEPFDETYIWHSTEIRRNIHRLDDVRVDRFLAEITKPDGRILPAATGSTTLSERIITRRLGESHRFIYSICVLEPGDILTVRYSLRFPFRNNWHRLFSTRIFFHGKYPKLNFHFEFSHPIELPIDTTISKIPPASVLDSLHDRIYTWNLKDLPGCLDEPGIRPYLDLPCFTFSLKPYELMYQHFDSFKDEFVPLWYYLCFDRERQVAKAFMDNSVGIKDKENLAMNKLAGRFTSQAGPDTSGFVRLSLFQRWMVDSVSYDNAFAFYDNQETYMTARPGLDLAGSTLVDNGIEFVYASMVLKLGMNFFTAYPADKRTGQISTRYFAPNFDNELLFAPVLLNDILVYLLPSSDYNHLFLEELPFYYEDVPVMLINTYDLGGYKMNMFESARIVRTPGSTLKDNYRKIRSEVYIDLEKLTAQFKTSITLSGQYSTLGRHAYLNRPVDPGIPSVYTHKAWETGNMEPPGSFHIETSREFPYKTVITADIASGKAVRASGKGYEIDIRGWFHLASPEIFNPVHRFTDYYPDFTGIDSYIFMLDFNIPVTMPNAPGNISISNDAGSFVFNVRQVSDHQILLTCHHTIASQKVKKEDIDQVYSIFHAISALPGTILVEPGSE